MNDLITRYRLGELWLSACIAFGLAYRLLSPIAMVVIVDDYPSDRGAYVCGDTGRLTPAPQTWIDALATCPGVEVYLWRPDDWPAIVERLKKRDTPNHREISRHEGERKP